MSRVYVAGPISGLPGVPLEEKKDRFYRAETRLRLQGHEVVNPLDIEPDCAGGCNPDGHIGQDGVPTHGHACFLRYDLMGMLTCDTFLLLPGYEESTGAMLELTIARALGMEIWGPGSIE